MESKEIKKRGRPRKENSGFVDKELSNKSKVVEKVDYRGDLRIIGKIVYSLQDKDTIGYVVMVEKNRVLKSYTVEQTIILLKKFQFVNAKLEDGKIVNIECSSDRLVKFDTNLRVLDKNKITILGEISDKDDEKSVGYRIFDSNCKVVDVSEKELLDLLNIGYELVNGKTVNRNNKNYISGIKTDFTKIEKSKADNLKKLSKNMEIRNQRHREKLYIYTKYFMREKALSVKDIGDTHNVLTRSMMIKTKRSDGCYYYYPKKEAEILIKEVISKYVTKEDDRKLLQSIYKESQSLPEMIRTSDFFFDTKIVTIFSCIYQFALYIPEVSKEVNARLDNLSVSDLYASKSPLREFSVYRVSKEFSRYNKKRCKDNDLTIENSKEWDYIKRVLIWLEKTEKEDRSSLFNSYFLSIYIPLNKRCKAMMDLDKAFRVKHKKLLDKVLLDYAERRKEILELDPVKTYFNLAKNNRSNEESFRKEVVRDFKLVPKSGYRKSSEIAELGFAMFEKNKDIIYTTSYGTKYTLKFLGDFLSNYDRYLKKAYTFGDVYCLAAIHKLINIDEYWKPRYYCKDKDIVYERTYWDTAGQRQEESISRYTKIEILMALMSIYNPKLLKDYIETELGFVYDYDANSSGNVNDPKLRYIVNHIKGDLDNIVDYKLDPRLRVYYDSGFNAFYLKEEDVLKKYRHRSKKEELLASIDFENDICVFRNKYSLWDSISHPLLNELVSVIGLIVSDNVKIKEIETLIGLLREF